MMYISDLTIVLFTITLLLMSVGLTLKWQASRYADEDAAE